MVKHDTELADAAAGFDHELAAYTRLGELFVQAPVGSVKQLERANTTLGEIAECEDRLQTAAQRLVQALGAARARQEQLAKDVVARVPVVRDRNRRLQELMADLAGVTTQVGALNTSIAGQRDNGDPTQPPTAETVR